MNFNIKDQSGNVLGRLELAEGLSVEPEASGPPAPPQQVPQKVMTAAAAGYSREDFIRGGWTDEQLMAHGLMTIENVSAPAPQSEPAQLHPSVANTQLGPEWQPEPPPSPEPPPAPQPEAAAPPAPEVPVADNTAPPAQAAPAAPQQSDSSTPESGYDEFWTADVPRIEGREFIVKGVSYEQAVDKRGIPFDGRVHGVSSDTGKPATKKDDTWKKKRGIDADYYTQIEEQLKQAMQGASQEQAPAAPEAPAAPTPPAPPQGDQQAPAAPQVPAPPGGAPDVAPEQPENLAALENALSDWEEV